MIKFFSILQIPIGGCLILYKKSLCNEDPIYV